MATYPYVLVPNRLKQFLATIPKTSVPPTVTLKTLQGLGFKSTNDRAIVGVLKFLNFIDMSGRPTKEVWQVYRSTAEGPRALGNAIRTAYRNLFDVYPDAENQSEQTLKDLIRSHTDSSDVTLSRQVSTFLTLCNLAKFDGNAYNASDPQSPGQSQGKDTAGQQDGSSQSNHVATPSGGMTLNINIELHLPATQDGDIYDKLFASLRRNLMQDK